MLRSFHGSISLAQSLHSGFGVSTSEGRASPPLLGRLAGCGVSGTSSPSGPFSPVVRQSRCSIVIYRERSDLQPSTHVQYLSRVIDTSLDQVFSSCSFRFLLHSCGKSYLATLLLWGSFFQETAITAASPVTLGLRHQKTFPLPFPYHRQALRRYGGDFRGYGGRRVVHFRFRPCPCRCIQTRLWRAAGLIYLIRWPQS